MSESLKITVVGAGSWGTALAALLAEKGSNVTLWAYEPEVADGINRSHQNPYYLSKYNLPKNLHAENNLEEALSQSNIVVSVIPSHVLRKVMEKAAPHIKRDAIIVSCTKGIETSTKKLVSDILKETLTNIDEERLTYLSGPSFASEVIQKLPTMVVIAGKNSENTKKIQEIFRTSYFMPFIHDDIIGVELGGALKNVIAIATGMSDGLGFGANCRAALITRGLYEMIKIGKVMGANPFTFTGLSGMGDLILTCTSTNSRNYTLGYKLGQGKKLDDILSEMKMVAEGVKTSQAIYEITARYKINAPICKEMYSILYNQKSVKDAAKDLTSLELKEELRNILV